MTFFFSFVFFIWAFGIRKKRSASMLPWYFCLLRWSMNRNIDQAMDSSVFSWDRVIISCLRMNTFPIKATLSIIILRDFLFLLLLSKTPIPWNHRFNGWKTLKLLHWWDCISFSDENQTTNPPTHHLTSHFNNYKRLFAILERARGESNWRKKILNKSISKWIDE